MEPKRVLVPVSGDEADKAAVRLACTAIGKGNGTIYLLNVVEVGRKFPLDAPDPQLVERGEAVLERMEIIAKQERCHVETELIPAREAGPALLVKAKERGAELIVMGLSRKSRHVEYDLGRTVLHVLEWAPCRVWLARGPLGAETPEPVMARRSNGFHLPFFRR